MTDELVPRDRALAELRTLATRDHWVALWALQRAAESLDALTLGYVLDAALEATAELEDAAGDFVQLLLRERWSR